MGRASFRLLLYSLPWLAGGLMALGHAWKPKFVGAIGAAALTLQLSGALLAVERSSGPPSMRNFVENRAAPLVFPLKSLLREAQQKGFLSKDAVVLVSLVTWGTVPGVPVTFGPFGEQYCECTAERPNVMPLFVRYTNFNAGALEHDRNAFALYPALDSLWRRQLQARPICLAKLKLSCGHVLERVEQGETTAALGIR